MDKIEQRAVIKYLFKKGLTPKNIHNDMTETLGESAPSYTTVKKWVAEFKRGRESIEDDPRSGRPTTSTTPENIHKVCDLILENRRLTIKEIADTIGISYERTQNIIINELGFYMYPLDGCLDCGDFSGAKTNSPYKFSRLFGDDRS